MESFSESYIKKCKACEDIQKLWNPIYLDNFGNINNNVFQFGDRESARLIDKTLYFWIPSLYQIIDLCRNMDRMKAQKVNDLTLLSKMRISISSSCCNNYLNSQTMHDFWIMFYMTMNHGKEWNEGANKWI